MSIWEIIGFVASCFSAIQLIPEVIKSWRCKNLDEVAWGTINFVIIGQVLWLIYGFKFGLWPIIIAGVVHGVMGMSLAYLKIKYAPVRIKVADGTSTLTETQVSIQAD